ncbi:MAG: glycosyltransferase family 4 protein, partial [Thermomicrobiales bacterium]
MRIALVHDYLSQYGGAERVLEIIHGRYPDAPVVTAVLDRGELPRAFDGMEISASWLERVPGSGRHHRLLFPLYPLVFATMGRPLRGCDVVLADSRAWAHHISLKPENVLVCY